MRAGWPGIGHGQLPAARCAAGGSRAGIAAPVVTDQSAEAVDSSLGARSTQPARSKNVWTVGGPPTRQCNL